MPEINVSRKSKKSTINTGNIELTQFLKIIRYIINVVLKIYIKIKLIILVTIFVLKKNRIVLKLIITSKNKDKNILKFNIVIQKSDI